MSDIDKQWLQQKIADMEAARDEIPFGLDEDDTKTLAAMRIALASLEADGDSEPVAFINGAWTLVYYRPPKELGLKIGDKLYTTPPAPVSVPNEATPENIEILASTYAPCGVTYQWDRDECNAAADSWNACRAAMLQGAEKVESRCTIKTAPALDSSPKNAESRCCKSPVIPDGYCIMPLKLTADNGAKGALCGEFHVQYRIVCQSCVGEGCEDCNHTGGWNAEIPVSWDTIKRIHESAVEACALPAAPRQEVKP